MGTTITTSLATATTTTTVTTTTTTTTTITTDSFQEKLKEAQELFGADNLEKYLVYLSKYFAKNLFNCSS